MKYFIGFFYYVMAKIIKSNQTESISLKTFNDRKNKILIYRQFGGLGDIFMMRMMFEDFKKIDKTNKLYFACPSHLKDAVIDHPFLDGILDAETVNKNEYYTYEKNKTSCLLLQLCYEKYGQVHTGGFPISCRVWSFLLLFTVLLIGLFGSQKQAK